MLCSEVRRFPFTSLLYLHLSSAGRNIRLPARLLQREIQHRRRWLRLQIFPYNFVGFYARMPSPPSSAYFSGSVICFRFQSCGIGLNCHATSDSNVCGMAPSIREAMCHPVDITRQRRRWQQVHRKRRISE